MYSTQVVTVLYASAVKLVGLLAHNLSEDVGGTWCRRFCQGKSCESQWTHDRVSRFLRESTEVSASILFGSFAPVRRSSKRHALMTEN